MTNPASTPLTHGQIVMAYRLIQGCQAGWPVIWSSDQGESVLKGTLRAITPAQNDPCFASPSEDIRTQWVRISSTFEHWLPVSQVLELMRDNLFVINAPGGEA